MVCGHLECSVHLEIAPSQNQMFSAAGSIETRVEIWINWLTLYVCHLKLSFCEK